MEGYGFYGLRGTERTEESGTELTSLGLIRYDQLCLRSHLGLRTIDPFSTRKETEIIIERIQVDEEEPMPDWMLAGLATSLGINFIFFLTVLICCLVTRNSRQFVKTEEVDSGKYSVETPGETAGKDVKL